MCTLISLNFGHIGLSCLVNLNMKIFKVLASSDWDYLLQYYLHIYKSHTTTIRPAFGPLHAKLSLLDYYLNESLTSQAIIAYSYGICLYNRVYIYKSSIKEWYPLCLSFSDLSGHKTLLILYQRNVWFVSINIGIYTLLLFNFWDRWKIETDPKMNSGWFETLSEQRSLITYDEITEVACAVIRQSLISGPTP
jgi:hypothetical protein